MKLYTYWRSSTAYRVRIALHLKGIAYSSHSVDLVAGAQKTSQYTGLNPGKSVPTLILDDGQVLTQSMAILDWLDSEYPEPPLFPKDSIERARHNSAALTIATDIHPVNNLKVLNKLKSLGHANEETIAWMQYWMLEGFEAFETLIEKDTPFCFGDKPGIADLCLIPQLYNAHRWNVDLAPFSRLADIEKQCLELPAFEASKPENQPDAR